MIDYFYRTHVLEALSDHLPIILSDMDTGEILWCTNVAEQLFGYSIRGEVVGLVVEELVPPEMRAKHAKHREAFAKSPHVRQMGNGLPIYGQRKDGRSFPVEIMLIPVMAAGRRCVVSLIFDMTSRTRKGVANAPVSGVDLG